jgi:hypothetical protein
MNTTPGTNTNPTAVALAEIVRNARELTLRQQELDLGYRVTSQRYEAILDAVVIIAKTNHNTFNEIMDLSNAVTP